MANTSWTPMTTGITGGSSGSCGWGTTHSRLLEWWSGQKILVLDMTQTPGTPWLSPQTPSSYQPQGMMRIPGKKLSVRMTRGTPGSKVLVRVTYISLTIEQKPWWWIRSMEATMSLTLSLLLIEVLLLNNKVIQFVLILYYCIWLLLISTKDLII